jgi:hypothetical protein
MRAAEMRTFAYGVHDLRCLAYVSACTVCGHRWKDPAYEAENSQLVNEAISAATHQQIGPDELRTDNASERCFE